MRATIVIMALSMSATAVASGGQTSAKIYFAQGVEAYREGRFEDAIAAYEQAHRALPNPAFLFNLGQCYRSLGELERSIVLFERYIEAKPQAANRAEVEALIDGMRLAVPVEPKAPEPEPAAKETAAKPAAVEAPVAAAEPPALPKLEPRVEPASQPELPSLVSPIAEASRDDAVVYEQWWFWAIVGGAAVATAGGVAIAANTLSGPETNPSPIGTLGSYRVQ